MVRDGAERLLTMRNCHRPCTTRHLAPVTANSHNLNSLPFPSPPGAPLMTDIRGAAAAVTGAASGIGRALADRDEAGLQSVAAEIATTTPQKVSIHRVDVGDPEQIAAFAQAAVS